MADVIAHFEITFDRDESCYKEGDTITGEVVVDLKEDMVIECTYCIKGRETKVMVLGLCIYKSYHRHNYL